MIVSKLENQNWRLLLKINLMVHEFLCMMKICHQQRRKLKEMGLQLTSVVNLVAAFFQGSLISSLLFCGELQELCAQHCGSPEMLSLPTRKVFTESKVSKAFARVKRDSEFRGPNGTDAPEQGVGHRIPSSSLHSIQPCPIGSTAHPRVLMKRRAFAAQAAHYKHGSSQRRQKGSPEPARTPQTAA